MASQGLVPPITTSRLLLRGLRLGDFEAYAAHMADPVATLHLSGVVDRRTAWRLFASLSGQWVLSGAGWWGIELAETSEFVGMVGAFYRESSLTDGVVRPDAEIELGWSILGAYWRRGIATEAARAVLAFAFERHESPRAIAQINTGNAASIAVSRAIGMTYERDVDFYGQPVGRYVIARVAH